MVVGIVLLLIISSLIYFGFIQRVLDHLHLSDKAALFIIFLMIVGSFIDIPLTKRPNITLNVGGALIPILLAIYVLTKADTNRERFQAIVASLLTGLAIYITSTFLLGHTLPQKDFIDSSLLFAIVAGVFAYLLGRSRRGAFVAGIGGITFYNLFNCLKFALADQPSTVKFGGAGIFDTLVLSSVLALGLTELYGGIIERLFTKTDRNEDSRQIDFLNHERNGAGEDEK